MVAQSVSSTTAKKARANRRNAKKSTGPRTAEGKAASSQNATSHGIYCRDIVLDGEDAELDEILGTEFENPESDETDDVQVDSSNTQNEPTAQESPTTSGPAEACEQSCEQIVDPPTQNAPPSIPIDPTQLSQLDKSGGS